MKKSITKISCIAALALTLNNTNAQTTFTQSWLKETGSHTVQLSAVDTDAYKNIYVAGATKDSASGNYNIIVSKIDSTGTLLWQYIYDDEYNGNDAATGVFADGDAVLVTGTIYNGTSHLNDIVTIKLSSSGSGVWLRTFNGSGSSLDAGGEVIVDSGNVYVAGAESTSSDGFNYIALKYNSSGTLQWSNTYDYASLNDLGGKIRVGSNSIYVMGMSQNNSTDWALATLELRKDNGSLLSSDRSSGIGTGVDYLNGVARDNAGNVYITGSVRNSNFDVRTIKLSPTLGIIWQHDYNGESNGDDAGYDIKVDSYGNVYVCGSTSTNELGKDYLIMKYHSSGTLLWAKTENGAGNDDDIARALCLDSNTNIYVTGESRNTTNVDYYTIRYCSSGYKTGSIYYNGNGDADDAATAIYMLDNETVIVSGTVNSSNKEYATISYSLNFGDPDACTQSETVSYSITAIEFTSDWAFIELTGQEFWVGQGDVIGFKILTSANNPQYNNFTYGMDVLYPVPFGTSCANLSAGTYTNNNNSTITWDNIITQGGVTPYSDFNQSPLGSFFTVDFNNVNYGSPILIKYQVTGGSYTYPETAYTIHFTNPPNGTIPSNVSCFGYHVLSYTDIKSHNNGSVSIYPNPTTDILNIVIDNNQKLKEVVITNSIGSIVLKDNNIQNKQLNVSHLEKGIYFAKIITDKTSIVKNINIK